jgi:hypothetical protein
VARFQALGPRRRRTNGDRDVALLGYLHHGPGHIYGDLLYHAREQGWRDGAAYYAFIEMFGVALRPKRSKS